MTIDDVLLELSKFNDSATDLLDKYSGVFDKLDEATQEKLKEIQNTLPITLNQNGVLVDKDGNEISVGNALKLEGKSLQEVKTLYYEYYSTKLASINLGTKNANTWFDLGNVKVTPKYDGIYLIIAQVRIWLSGWHGTDYGWKKARIVVGEEEREVGFMFNKYNADTNLDSSHILTTITPVKAGEVIKIQGYIDNLTKEIQISNGNGSTVLLAIKIG